MLFSTGFYECVLLWVKIWVLIYLGICYVFVKNCVHMCACCLDFLAFILVIMYLNAPNMLILLLLFGSLSALLDWCVIWIKPLNFLYILLLCFHFSWFPLINSFNIFIVKQILIQCSISMKFHETPSFSVTLTFKSTLSKWPLIHVEFFKLMLRLSFSWTQLRFWSKSPYYSISFHCIKFRVKIRDL